jgi:hypothetical protein
VEGDPRPEGGHRLRWFEMTLPTHDTSDTRQPGEDDADDGPSDSRPDGETGQETAFVLRAHGNNGCTE